MRALDELPEVIGEKRHLFATHRDGLPIAGCCGLATMIWARPPSLRTWFLADIVFVAPHPATRNTADRPPSKPASADDDAGFCRPVQT